ncbi:MAG: leucine-rich repeat domain-containing protein [Holosporales bacterium]|nr:leucine-rich repeat domain-containing protein [Holosporales bacterium]
MLISLVQYVQSHANEYIEIDGLTYYLDQYDNCAKIARSVLIHDHRKKLYIREKIILDGNVLETRAVDNNALYRRYIGVVYFPPSISIIGDRSFSMSNITNVAFEHNSLLQVIGKSAFAGNDFKTLTLPECIKVIGNMAFAFCHNLCFVPTQQYEDLVCFGKAAFANSSLQSFEVTLRTSIRNAFTDCESLCNIYFPKDVRYIEQEAFASAGITEITIPEQIYEIGTKAFYECPFLSKVDFASDDTLESIGYSAFARSGLLSIEIPSSVKYIGQSCFADCGYLHILFSCQSKLHSIEAKTFKNTNISEVYLPDSVEILGAESFAECRSLTKVICSENSRLRIIGNDAFRYSTLTSFDVPSSVHVINSYAFCDCNGLESVKFAKDSQLQRIDRNAFFFSYLMNDEALCLSSIVIPCSVERIGQYGFAKASSLKYVAFECGSVLTELSSDVFSFTGLSNITIPRSVQKIGSSCFLHTDALTSVTFEDGSCLHSIGREAFAFSGLNSIQIPGSVTKLKSLCFSNCKNLVSAIIQSSEHSCSDISLFPNIFSECSPSLIVHIPRILTNSECWKDDLLTEYFQDPEFPTDTHDANVDSAQSLVSSIDEIIENPWLLDPKDQPKRTLYPEVTISQFLGQPSQIMVTD